MVADHYRNKWDERDYLQPLIMHNWEPAVSRVEFDALKKEVADLVALLKRAKKYDEDNGEPDCEMDEKVAFLRKIAEFVGVDLDKAVGG